MKHLPVVALLCWGSGLVVALSGMGVVLSLSSVGTGVGVNTKAVLAKVVLTVVLDGLVFVTVRSSDVSRTEDRYRSIAIGGPWTIVFGLGIALGR